jgi:mannose-6-phosphate isomerase-like protein (cupin superfamily)
MTQVREHLDVFPFATAPRVLRRVESNLLTRAQPGPMGPLWSEVVPIDVVHFDQTYTKQPFAAPRFLYEGLHGRIEWQQMDFRQPFYHRNLDVDEMSYQIAGDRTLMTEYGTAELRTGDFVRIPVGVCHDNWGRQESHILWYLPEPCLERLPAQRTTQALIPPFEGWQAATVNELITDCMGSAGGHDTAAQRSDERLILEDALSHNERLAVVRPSSEASTGDGPRNIEWIWTGASSSIGMVNSGVSAGLDYIRHRNADEIQYQASGHRLLVTQHGVVEVVPGDFARIPIGVAFTSISTEPNRYIATVSYHRLPRVYEASRESELWSAQDVESRRSAVLQSAR